jgi:hypothetical protein
MRDYFYLFYLLNKFIYFISYIKIKLDYVRLIILNLLDFLNLLILQLSKNLRFFYSNGKINKSNYLRTKFIFSLFSKIIKRF